MKSKGCKLLAFAAALWLVQAVPAQAQDAGTIERVSGSATITGADNQTRPAAANERIRAGDTVTTDGRGEALVKLTDNSTVALRANTQFRFSEYRYEDKPTDSMASTLLRGAALLGPHATVIGNGLAAFPDQPFRRFFDALAGQAIDDAVAVVGIGVMQVIDGGHVHEQVEAAVLL